jgi:hypothetical protein
MLCLAGAGTIEVYLYANMLISMSSLVGSCGLGIAVTVTVSAM